MTVPNVVGMTEQAAVTALKEVGLVPVVQTTVVSDPKKDGIVLSQSPSEGSLVDTGTSVTVVVGKHKGGPH